MNLRQKFILAFIIIFMSLSLGGTVFSASLGMTPGSAEPILHLSPTARAVSVQVEPVSDPLVTQNTTFLPLLSNQLLPVSDPIPVGPLGGTFTALAIDPTQNDNIYVGSYYTGVYKSFDQGLTWYRMSVGLGNLQIQSLATHPTNASVVYAGTYGGGLYRSTNGGGTWLPINSGVLDNQIVYDIEIDPGNPNIVYVTSRPNGSLAGLLSKSTDGGTSWKVILYGSSFTTDDYFYDIDVNPLNSNELYLTPHEHGIYKSTNSGASFFAVNKGLTDLSSRSTAFDSYYTSLVYAGVWHNPGAFISRDAGATWSPKGYGLPTAGKVMKIFVDPFGGSQKRVFACTFGFGLYSSDNFGNNWTSRGLAGQGVNDFIIANGNPQRWYAAVQNNGLFRSSTLGTTWIGSNGNLRLNNITGLVTMPESSDAVFASIFGRGVFKVTDSGQNWEAINIGLNDLNVVKLVSTGNQLFALTLSGVYQYGIKGWSDVGLPQDTGFDFGTFASTASERISTREDQLVEEYANSSESLNTVNLLSGNVPIASLADKNGVLYGGTYGDGIWCNSGQTWERCGLDNYSIEAILEDPAQFHLFVSACLGEDDCSVFELEDNQWEDIGIGLGGLRVNQFTSSGGGYLSATDQGIYRWNEESRQWVITGLEGVNVLSIAAENMSSCMVAAGAEKGTYISRDCGQSWQIADPALKEWNYQEVAFDPVDPNMILFGSRESGAYLWNSVQR